MVKRCSIFLFFLTIFLLFMPRTVLAQSENEFIPAGSVIDSDFIRVANTVQIDGEIKGDAFLMGGLVTINGKIDGDLFVLGGKVTVNGEVGNSIRVLAGDVTLNSPVGRNVLLICGNCTLTKQAKLPGSLLVAGGNLQLSSPTVGKGFRFFGSRLYLDSIISNEAFVVAQQEFVLGPEASISGDLKYTGGKQVEMTGNATVSGKITYQLQNPGENFPRFFGAQTIFAVRERLRPLVDFGFLLIGGLVGYIFLGLFPKPFEKAIVAMQEKPVASFGWGIISIVIVPVVAVLLAITIVGLPVSLVLLLFGYAVYMLASFVGAFWLGRTILLRVVGERRGWALFVGLVVFYILGQIPFIGAFARLLITIPALGGLVLSYRHPAIYQEKKIEKLRTVPKKKSSR